MQRERKALTKAFPHIVIGQAGDIDNMSDYVVWYHEAGNVVSLDGQFTVDQLSAIVDYVRRQLRMCHD